MLLVANIANTKWCKYPENDLNPGTCADITQQELSSENEHDSV